MEDDKKINFGASNWGGYAACYDALNSLAPYQELQKTAAEQLGSLTEQKILEVACGTGNLTEMLLNQNRREEFGIWAIDFSQEMLERARQKCPDKRICFLRADLNRALPINGESFDKIASINTLYAVSDPKCVLNEFSRVLKPGGRLVVITPKNGYQNGLILKAHCKSQKPNDYWLDAHSSEARERQLISESVKDKYLAEQMIAVAKYNRIISKNSQFHFFKADDLARLIEECGFRIIKTSLTYARQGILVVAEKPKK